MCVRVCVYVYFHTYAWKCLFLWSRVHTSHPVLMKEHIPQKLNIGDSDWDSANYSLHAKFGLLPVLMHKVLLELSHAHVTYCLWPPSHYSNGAEELQWKFYGLLNLKYLQIGSLQKSCWPQLRQYFLEPSTTLEQFLVNNSQRRANNFRIKVFLL